MLGSCYTKWLCSRCYDPCSVKEEKYTFMPQSWNSEKGLNNNNPNTIIPYTLLLMLLRLPGWNRGCGWHRLSVFLHRSLWQRTICNILSLSTARTHTPTTKWKSRKVGEQGSATKTAKKICRGRAAVQVKRLKMLKILTTVIKRCFALFRSNISSMRIPFSLL